MLYISNLPDLKFDKSSIIVFQFKVIFLIYIYIYICLKSKLCNFKLEKKDGDILSNVRFEKSQS